MISDLPRITATWRDRMAVGHEVQADLAHLLAEAGHFLVGHRQRGLGRDVAQRRAGAAGGQHQVAAFAIVHQLRTARRSIGELLVRASGAVCHSTGLNSAWASQCLQRRDALVLVDAGGGAVADRDQPDADQLEAFCRAQASSSVVAFVRCLRPCRPRRWPT